MLLLKQDNIKKGRVNKMTSRLEFENDGNGEEYKVEVTCDSTMYAKESDSGHHLPSLYYLV